MKNTAFIIYLTVLAVSPLLFGSVNTYAYTFMSAGVFVASSLLLIGNINKDIRTGQYYIKLPKTGLTLLFTGVLAYLFFQVISMPDSLVSLLSPEAKTVWEKSLPASDILSGATTGRWLSLSGYYYPVRQSIVRFIVYGFLFFGLSSILYYRIVIFWRWIILIVCCLKLGIDMSEIADSYACQFILRKHIHASLNKSASGIIIGVYCFESAYCIIRV